MESFRGQLAVVTGGGSGMGRELVIQLAAEGCSVAACDVDQERVDAVAAMAGPETRVTAHACDVSDESQVLRLRDEVVDSHSADHVDLLFNNAGIGGGGSFVTDAREVWERTFAVDWWGVYYCTRAFLPLMLESQEAILVNTSSVNGFWATLGPGMPNSAYSTAKFAVKGFSEALIEDLRVNAPQVRVAVVMPGHVGTDIVQNSWKAHGKYMEGMSPRELDEARSYLRRFGFASERATAEEIGRALRGISDAFKEGAPISAADAASAILDGLRLGKWRILVGEDAFALDARVRADPDHAYDPPPPAL